MPVCISRHWSVLMHPLWRMDACNWHRAITSRALSVKAGNRFKKMLWSIFLYRQSRVMPYFLIPLHHIVRNQTAPIQQDVYYMLPIIACLKAIIDANTTSTSAKVTHPIVSENQTRNMYFASDPADQGRNEYWLFCSYFSVSGQYSFIENIFPEVTLKIISIHDINVASRP